MPRRPGSSRVRARSAGRSASHSTRASPRPSRPDLKRLFLGKCAYCESPVPIASFSDADCFRPRTGSRGSVRWDLEAQGWHEASQRSGRVLVAGLRVVQPVPLLHRVRAEQTQSVPGGRTSSGDPFTRGGAPKGAGGVDRPVRRSARAVLRLPEVGPDREPPSDPDAIERRDGGRYGSVDRARSTIAILGLNRPALVEARRKEYERLRDEFQSHQQAGSCPKAVQSRSRPIRVGPTPACAGSS